MSEEEIRNVLEAALLAAGRALTLPDLAQLFDESQRPDPAALRAALARLEADYAQRAFELKQTASGYRLQIRSRYGAVIARLWPERPQRYSRALLETLALIAYRQPITRAEIEAIRGVAVNPNIVKTLLERRWIRVVGHRELPGHPELLGTTREFLDYFGLRTLQELPPLAELRSLEDPNEPDLRLELPDAQAAAPSLPEAAGGEAGDGEMTDGEMTDGEAADGEGMDAEAAADEPADSQAAAASSTEAEEGSPLAADSTVLVASPCDPLL